MPIIMTGKKFQSENGFVALDDTLLFVGNSSELIYQDDQFDGSIETTYDPSIGNLTALAYDYSSGNLISGDDFGNALYIHDGISTSINSTIDYSNASPTRLSVFAVDQNTGNLLVSSREALYLYDGISTNLITELNIGGQSATNNAIYGIWLDENSDMIILRRGGNVEKYDGVSTTLLDEFTSRSEAYGIVTIPSTGEYVIGSFSGTTYEVYDSDFSGTLNRDFDVGVGNRRDTTVIPS